MKKAKLSTSFNSPEEFQIAIVDQSEKDELILGKISYLNQRLKIRN